MVPQLRQGFLQPGLVRATGKPQRLQVGGTAGKRGRGEGECTAQRSLSKEGSSRDTFPASLLSRRLPLSNPICSRQKRIGQALQPYGRVEPVPAVHHGGVGQGEKLRVYGVHQRTGIASRQ